MTTAVIPVVLVVYSREACHLCQQMIAALRERQAKLSFDFEIIDIDSNQELVALYNERVPVLMAPKDKHEICNYHLDVDALDAYLAKVR